VKKHLLAVVALAGMASAHAGELNYSYAEAGYGMVDLDFVTEEGDGYFVGGSFGVGNFLGFAEFATAEFDEDGGEATLDEIQVGFGAHFAMSDNVDFVGKLGYVEQSVEVDTPLGSASADENGFMLSAGVRALAVEKLDLSAAIEYVDIGEEDDTGIALRGVYDFTSMFSMGARAEFSDDANMYGVFARMRF
jgi:opacity protein-like surface antigen